MGGYEACNEAARSGMAENEEGVRGILRTRSDSGVLGFAFG